MPYGYMTRAPRGFGCGALLIGDAPAAGRSGAGAAVGSDVHVRLGGGGAVSYPRCPAAIVLGSAGVPGTRRAAGVLTPPERVPGLPVPFLGTESVAVRLRSVCRPQVRDVCASFPLVASRLLLEICLALPAVAVRRVRHDRNQDEDFHGSHAVSRVRPTGDRRNAPPPRLSDALAPRYGPETPGWLPR